MQHAEQERDSVRSRLAAERAVLAESVVAGSRSLEGLLASQRDTAADDEHDPEGPTVAIQRAEAAAMLLQSRRHLAEVDAALHRLSTGTYGVCASCGRDIPKSRLQARPEAELCVHCAERVGR